jgi:hypothetical protein
MQNFISEFIQYAFTGKPQNKLPDKTLPYPIEEVSIEEVNLSSEQTTQLPSSQENAINKFILALNWTALGVSIVLLCVIVFYAIFRPNQQVPCIIENLLATPAGYLGGVVATFWKKYAETR